MPELLLAAYERDRSALVQFLWRRLRDAATAEDLVQDSYLKIFQAGGDLQLLRIQRGNVVKRPGQGCTKI